jgi:class 3 adenylate cyclase
MHDVSQKPLAVRFDSDLGVFVEEVTADLVRFEVAASASCAPDRVAVEREVPLGAPDAYADILVQAPGEPPFFIEVKIGYSARELVGRIARKYGAGVRLAVPAARLVLVVRRADHADWPALEADLRAALHPALALEIWDDEDLLARLRRIFADDIHALTREELLDTRRAIERAHWRLAFGGRYADYPSTATLQWHFSPWELQRLAGEKGLAPEQILSPRIYEQVVVLMCDLCSFSSFVRDTRDPQLIRRRLTEFYSLARHAVHNAGGMIYQFVGDEVVALFGLNELPAPAAAKALRCAGALFDIGRAVSDAWQRALDRVQPSRGVHIGVAVGDLNLLPLRPFSRTHIGFIGDAINMAARLMAEAKADEAVMSNGVWRLLDEERRSDLVELEPVEAKNVGRIRAWKMRRAGP